MFNLLHSNTNQELLKSTSVIKVATLKNTNGTVYLSYFQSAITAVWIKNCLSISVNHSHYEKYGQFCKGSHHVLATTKSALFTVKKGEWDTKEDTIDNTLYRGCMYNSMPKGTEEMWNSEKIKPVALAIIKLHLSEGIGHSVGWSVGRSACQPASLIMDIAN